MKRLGRYSRDSSADVAGVDPASQPEDGILGSSPRIVVSKAAMSFVVMAGLDLAIQSNEPSGLSLWMAASSAAMTVSAGFPYERGRRQCR
jgi:hypothetical protein